NRSMFWRVLRRSVFANRGRLFVILLALGAGSAVTAALLNLQIDAKRRITTEFRSFGANVIISPRTAGDSQRFLSEKLFDQIPAGTKDGPIAKVEYLYGVSEVSVYNGDSDRPSNSRPVILAGYSYAESGAKNVVPATLLDYEDQTKTVSS